MNLSKYNIKCTHLPTGKVYIKEQGSQYYRHNDSDSDRVPEKIVENGLDWKIITMSKEKLFTTEDGVDIYNREEKLWIIGTHSELAWKPVNRRWIGFPSEISNNKVFSTREAAEEYILMNKPCLSVSNILDMGFEPSSIRENVKNKLRVLAKSKL